MNVLCVFMGNCCEAHIKISSCTLKKTLLHIVSKGHNKFISGLYEACIIHIVIVKNTSISQISGRNEHACILYGARL